MRGKFDMLGRHFARDCDVTVRQEEDATPSADLERGVVTLPCNLADGQNAVVLAWLMHECGHIEWSQPLAECLDGPGLNSFLNALEDIRVDRRVFRRYRAAKNHLFRRSAEHARSSRDGWRNFKRPARILVSLILRAEGFEGPATALFASSVASAGGPV